MSLWRSSDSRPTKVLYCIDKLVRGGTELQVMGIIERLDRTRYKPYLLTIRPTDPQLIPGQCEHVALNVPTLFSVSGLRSMYWLIRFLRSEGIEVVQTFFPDSTIFGGLASRLAMTPARIACFRDLAFWSDWKQTMLLKRIYPMMNGYLCNANVVLEHFADQFGIDRERALVIRNGIDPTELPFKEHSGPTTNIGIVGNMTRSVKRTDLFIRAAALVHRHYPDIHWHVLGDGHLRPELEQLAGELGLSGKITFAGRVEDVPGYLSQLQVGVICSDSEGLSNALLEYMFLGVAAVATDAGGNTELVEDGVTGLVIPPGQAAALAAALIRLIEQPSLRQQIAFSARKKAEQSYSWERCLSEHYDAYRALLAGRGMEQLV